ncbi:hypothetical protein GCM10011247_16100 [Pseudomonas plecoglossicida]|nr:hypothetical protein GCM10011247_16100 [Pseudomonas plecoglossicida]
MLGRGWVLPWEQSLRRNGSFIYLTDNQGREVPFVTLQPGERIYNPHEQVYLVCTEGGHYLLQTLDNLFFYFGEVPDTDTDVPLQRIENALGHFLHFTRTPDGTLTDISATGGTRVHLHYDNPLGRLTDIKRVVNNEAVETLTQYRYDEHGQLSAVINRNGDTVRSFSYAEGLMVSHSNALGLGCHYRWETLDGQPRVVEHWTSDGEHFQFRYDLDNRTSWATDVLGRELEVLYNADHRVIASRDYGGERYAIELDDNGNMVGLTLADGNRLQFTYDEYARLLEEFDPLGRKIAYEYRGTASCRALAMTARTDWCVPRHWSMASWRVPGSIGTTASGAGLPNRRKSTARSSRSGSCGRGCGCFVRRRRGRASCTCTSRVAMRRWRGLIRQKGKNRSSTTSTRTRLARRWS